VSLPPVPSLPRGTVISVVKNLGTWVVGLACPACPERACHELAEWSKGTLDACHARGVVGRWTPADGWPDTTLKRGLASDS